MVSKRELPELVELHSEFVWQKLHRQHPELKNFECPDVRLNNRIYRTAGRCFQRLGVVEFSAQVFLYSADFYHTMMQVIVPHELIHQADFYLHGESDKSCGHGKTWCNLMLKYGLEPDPYCNLWIPK